MQSNYDEKTSPYAKFKPADTVTPAREAYELRKLEQLDSRWGSGEVERVSSQRSTVEGEDSVAVVAGTGTLRATKRPPSTLRATMDP